VTTKTDEDIRRHVEAELFCCPDVDESAIAVRVTEGTATLSGFVRRLLDKYGAEDVVRRVAGVLAVANCLQVLGATTPAAPPASRDSQPAQSFFASKRPAENKKPIPIKVR
jgi:hypothetical protein